MNIILLISDTFRYDNLFDRAGAMPVNTPSLDAFSARAISMSNFYAGSFPTIPQRTDLTSGRYGWPCYGWQNITASTRNHMPRILGNAGYATQLICDCPHLFNAEFHKGFRGAFALRGHEGDTHLLRMNAPIEHVMPPQKTRQKPSPNGATLADLHAWCNADWHGETDRLTPRTAETVVRWLEENYRYDPLFLWVDFFDPHEPWDPPEYMVRKYDPDYDGVPMIHPNYGKAGDYTRAELKNLRAHYCAEAELVDRWVGRVLQKIDDLDLWDNSIVIFTSDHGLHLGERNKTGKTNISDSDKRYWPLYSEIAHVPFLIAAPGLEAGRTVDAICQPVDILPTLLDLAGLDVSTPEPMHGRSFAPQLRGDSDEPVNPFAICGTTPRLRDSSYPPGSSPPVLYTGKWAYAPLGEEGQPVLLAIENNPLSEENLAHQYPEVVRDLHVKLVDRLRDLDAPAATIAALEGGK